MAGITHTQVKVDFIWLVNVVNVGPNPEPCATAYQQGTLLQTCHKCLQAPTMGPALELAQLHVLLRNVLPHYEYLLHPLQTELHHNFSCLYMKNVPTSDGSDINN